MTMRKLLPRVLFAIAALPFAGVALLHCTKPAADPAAGAVDAAASVAASVAVIPAASDAAVAVAPEDAAVTIASGSSSAPPKPSVTRADCLALAKAHGDYIAAHQSCTSDGDCDETNASCGLAAVCGAAINKGFKKGVLAKDDAFTSAGCMSVLAAPCPSCPYLGKPKCVAGRCELVK